MCFSDARVGDGEGLTGIVESLAKPLGPRIGDFGAWDTSGMESNRDDALGTVVYRYFLVRTRNMWDSKYRE